MKSRAVSNLVVVVLVVAACAGYAWHSAPRDQIYPEKTVVIDESAESAATPVPGADKVVVKALAKPITTEPGKVEELLFSEFAYVPVDKAMDSYTTQNWKAHYRSFSAALVKKAAVQKLAASSLSRILVLILTDANRLAYLPVGAYEASFNGRPVWIVTVKWEAGLGGEDYKLSLIRIYAFDRETLKQVGFATCG